MCNLGEGLVEETERRTRINERVEAVLKVMAYYGESAQNAANVLCASEEEKRQVLEQVCERLALQEKEKTADKGTAVKLC